MFMTQVVAARYKRKHFAVFLLVLASLVLQSSDSWAQVIYSAHVNSVDEKVTVRGNNLDAVAGFTLGGVAVSTANETPSTLDIPFSSDVAAAVQWPGSYRLVADGSAFASVYFAEPVDAPGEPPPPPPPPPPAGPDCPCIAGWEASGIPQDNFTLCFYDYNSQQQWIAGQKGEWFISAALDPYNLYFDPADPGNSVSYCALNDGVDWIVAEPVVNQDQFDDCDHWMWLHVCL